MAAAAAGVDWSVFLGLVRRHRMGALALDALGQAGVRPGAAEAAALKALAEKVAMQNLAALAECNRLAALLTAAGVGHLFFKGVSAAQQLHGGLGLRHSRDVDLLVAPDAVEAAGRVLEQAGYRRVIPRSEASAVEVAAHRRVMNDMEYAHPAAGRVELHWRLMPNPRQLARPLSSLARTPIVGRRGPEGLSGDDLFVYLAAHGARCLWFRLKWVADIAAMLAGKPDGEIERLHGVARSRGLGRSAGLALKLAEQLCGSALPPALSAALDADPAVRWLVEVSMQALQSGRDEIAQPDLQLRRMAMTRAHFVLAEGPAAKLAELRFKLLRPGTDEAALIPDRLDWLRPVLRPLLLVRRRLRRGAAARPG